MKQLSRMYSDDYQLLRNLREETNEFVNGDREIHNHYGIRNYHEYGYKGKDKGVKMETISINTTLRLEIKIKIITYGKKQIITKDIISHDLDRNSYTIFSEGYKAVLKRELFQDKKSIQELYKSIDESGHEQYIKDEWKDIVKDLETFNKETNKYVGTKRFKNSIETIKNDVKEEYEKTIREMKEYRDFNNNKELETYIRKLGRKLEKINLLKY